MAAILAFSIAVLVFIIVLWLTNWLIRYLKRIGLVVIDNHKEGHPLVPLSGGLAVAAGTLAGVLAFIFFRTFFPAYGEDLIINDTTLVSLFAGLITLLIITLIGFLDDIIIKKGNTESGGLRQWQKPLIALAAAVPLVVINAGVSTIALPLIGKIDVGVLYPLVLVPIGVVGAANMVNLLGGFNGLETGLGIVSIGMLGIYSYVQHRPLPALIALMAVSSLCAFYIYNRYPARIFPGDSLTYFLGGTIAIIAIIGNMERAALIVSIPYLIEFILKARGKFKKTSVGTVENDKPKSYYKEIYSLPHIMTRTGRYTERQVVYTLVLAHLLIAQLIWLL